MIRPALRARLCSWLVHPRFPIITGLLAGALAAPSLRVGIIGDDYWHRAVLTGSPRFAEWGLLKSGSILELFRFLDGDPERAKRLMDVGILPWWTDPQIRGAFLRPVTGITHWLDYRLWPDSPALMHMHSMLWLAGLAAAAALLYRRVSGAVAAAGLAALLYAVDDARGGPVGFLANRNALIAGVFGILALISHDEWRRSRRIWCAGLAAGALALSLLSAEAGVGIVGYLVAYAIVLDRAGWRRGLLSLTPYAVLAVLWRLVWNFAGYGVSPGMEFYVDPLEEPGRFLWLLIRRAPVVLWGQWLSFSDVSIVLPPDWQWGLWLAALVLIGWLAGGFASTLRREPIAAFWCVGMILAVVPACTTVPSDRMLIYVGLGAFGLMGIVGERALMRDLPGAEKRFAKSWTVRVLLGVHLVLAPLLLVLRAANPIGPMALIERLQEPVPAGESVEGRTVIVANPPVAMMAGFLPIVRTDSGRPLPAHLRVLGPSFQDLEICRTQERTLVVRPPNGYFSFALDQLFRGIHRPFLTGERVALSGVTITIADLTADGRPSEVTFEFDAPLEDPKWLWVVWDGGGFVTFAPPRVGDCRSISRVGE